MTKQTIRTIKKQKGGEKLTVITAYDYLFSRLFDGRVDMILVGDSLGPSFAGFPDTLPVTLDTMLYHAKAVCKGAPGTFTIFDMPYGTYTTEAMALENALRAYRETTVDAVKIEGGVQKAQIIETLTANGVAVMGHIGLLPQSVRGDGGFRVKGKSDDEIADLITDARAVEKAGAFAMVIEGVTADAGEAITNAVGIPTIGIGAGARTDGQVLVWSDMLGFFNDFRPKFVRRYMEGDTLVREALAQYTADVKSGAFPGEAESY